MFLILNALNLQALCKKNKMCKSYGMRDIQIHNKLALISQYTDIIIGMMESQITSLTNVYWTVYSGADQRKYQSSASLAFVRGIHRGQVNSPH